MKGHISVTVTKRTGPHLDPQDPQHAIDRAASLKMQAWDELSARTEELFGEPVSLKFQSLGGGFTCAPDGRIMSGSQHKNALDGILDSRSWYLGETVKRGKYIQRERDTHPLWSLASLLRPHHSAGLLELDTNPKNWPKLKRLFRWLGKQLAAEFERRTGLEVVAIEIHPEENNPHIHITFASVSADHRLLWARGHVGRHGLRMLGPSLIGALWQIKHGLRTKEDEELAKRIFKERCREADGEPIDWHMTDQLEKWIDSWIDKNGFRPVFDRALEGYLASARAKLAEKADKVHLVQERDDVVARATSLEQENCQKEKEKNEATKKVKERDEKIAALEQELATAKKGKDDLSLR